MTKLQGAWIWYELMVPDAPHAKTFYEAVVGWTINLGTEAPLHYGMIGNADGGMTGGVLPITQEMTAKGASPAWVGYIGTDNVEATIASVEAHGGRLLMPVMEIDEGRFAMVADCCGASFYVMTPKSADAVSTSWSPSMIGRCGWNELQAGNIVDAEAFYTGVFGWELAGSMDMGELGAYQFLALDGQTFGGMMQKTPHSPAAAWNFYFRVANIDDAAAAIVTHAGLILHGPVQVPGGDWVLNGVDPQGARFSLVGAKGGLIAG
jgi:predicted enzyme related to lactoylglutathione lyase